MERKSITDTRQALAPVFQYVVVALLVVSAYLIGSLKTKVEYMEKGGTATKAATAQTQDPAQPAKPNVSMDTIKDTFNKSQIKFGDAKKKLILVEVTDPSCPYCHIAAGKNPELNTQAGDRFKLVADGGSYVAPVAEFEKLVKDGKASLVVLYSNGHGNGEMGMKAMYCASENDKFWEVHNALMTKAGYDLLNNTVKNDKTKAGELAAFLKSAMNENDLKTCLESGKFDNRISEDVALAQAIGIQGTPGFYVNDQLFAGAYSYVDMESAVKKFL